MSKLFSTFKTFLAASSVLVLAACPSGNAPQSKPSAQGQNTVPHTAPKPKATVVLALGGGTSEGFTHIGIIKVLKGNNIPIKIATSTSAGSVAGSMYASGMSPDRLELEAEILGRTDLVDLTLSVGGFIKGERLQNYTNREVDNRPIWQFPIKFITVATDFENGKLVVFSVGNTGQAVRTSASIPSVFQPVIIGSRKYIDDGLSQPVPVNAMKRLGTNFIIAVDISACPAKNVSQDMFSYLDQTVNVMSRTTLCQELGQTNVAIKPQVLELGSIDDFDQKQRAIQLGEWATRTALPEIKRGLATYQY